jgi:hypothetical protein
VVDVPRVTVRPLVMCCCRWDDGTTEYCRVPAVRMRRTPGEPAPQFFCVYHASPTDELLTDDAIFRLVSITMEVRLCGVSETPGVAHAEALARLEQAIRLAGGVINLHACRSMLVRAEPSPPPSQPEGERVRGH